MHGAPIEKASSYGGFRMVLDVFGLVNGGGGRRLHNATNMLLSN
jgi:hypothetical protein